MNPALAYELAKICAEVNDGHSLSLECGNVACRVLMPDSIEMPRGVPEGAALVVFAGSNDFWDWIKNVSILKKGFPPYGMVHGGFLDCFLKIQKALDIHMQGCRDIAFSGHSQGGAIAILAAAHFYQRGHGVPAVYTFGSPRPGSEQFRDAYRATGIPTYRVVVDWDGVPRHPDSIEDFHCGKGYFYTSAGKPCKEQPAPAWYAPWRWLRNPIKNHIALKSYVPALKKAAGL